MSSIYIALSLLCGDQKRQNPARVKYWEIIADNLSKAGWSWGCASAVDSQGRKIWIADAHRDDRKRFVGRPDEKLTAFVDFESVTRAASGWLQRLLGRSILNSKTRLLSQVCANLSRIMSAKSLRLASDDSITFRK